MLFSFYIVLATLPSLVWLLFYLRKDKHPEPNSMVIKVFTLGILSAFAAVILEKFFIAGLEKFPFRSLFPLVIITGMAFIEELSKYAVVRLSIFKNPNFDEPIDAMIYMIIAGLGFAAAENGFLVNTLYNLNVSFENTLGLIFGRFISAVFLHALCSGIIGFFLAYSLLLKEKRWSFVFSGILLATGLHGFYNYIIINIELGKGNFYILTLALFLILMAVFVSKGFKHLKKLKSVCKT